MERLDISVAPDHANLEAAIHFSRYAISKNLVMGRRVLDIACGEGYGSYLLKQAGAERVVGVDISKESISKAERIFGQDGIEFKAIDAAGVDSLFSENEFDVVISIETIEHLTDPISFLECLKRITKPEGIIVLSCPNDHWYYPNDDQRNPYHERKYRLEDFQKLTTGVLGSNVRWSVGTGVFGFGSTPLTSEGNYSKIPGSWMSFMDVGASYLVNGTAELETSATQCSYFIGVWNAPDWTTGIAVFPLSMDDYAAKVNSHTEQSRLNAECETVRTSLNHVESDLRAARHEMRKLGLMLHASRAECEAVKEALVSTYAERSKLRSECDVYRLGHDRYVRLRRIVPSPLRSLLVKLARLIRR